MPLPITCAFEIGMRSGYTEASATKLVSSPNQVDSHRYGKGAEEHNRCDC